MKGTQHAPASEHSCSEFAASVPPCHVNIVRAVSLGDGGVLHLGHTSSLQCDQAWPGNHCSIVYAVSAEHYAVALTGSSKLNHRSQQQMQHLDIRLLRKAILPLVCGVQLPSTLTAHDVHHLLQPFVASNASNDEHIR
jgi:hypothetical protein